MTPSEFSLHRRLAPMLLVLRASVFLVLLMWALDKLLNPDHTAAVFATFYGIDNLGTIASYVLGVLQAIVALAFLVGAFKPYSYGLVLVMHAISTFASFPRYLAPYEGSNLLFFAAWPMLAACCALFVLRREDTIATINPKEPTTSR